MQQVSYAHNELLRYTGFFNVRRGCMGNLSTRDLGIIYVSSEGRVGCEFIHPAQPTDAPSSRRSSRSHFYTPGFPRGCIYIYNINKFKSNNIFKKLYINSDMNKFLYINHHIIYLYIMHFLLCIYTKMCISIPFICVLS